jgi:anhydro-N-acetylmuramic acid kinase
MSKDHRIIAGAMSGTSADGVDVALVDITGHGMDMSSRVLGWKHRDYSVELKRKIWEIRWGKGVEMG